MIVRIPQLLALSTLAAASPSSTSPNSLLRRRPGLGGGDAARRRRRRVLRKEGGSRANGKPGGEVSTWTDHRPCPKSLACSLSIDSDATLYYAIVPSDPPGSRNGVLCVRLEVSDHEGWVSLGFSDSGGRMVGSEAVIGLLEENTVLKYDMRGKWKGGVDQKPEERQTLRDASVWHERGKTGPEKGKTVLKFAKLIEEEGEVAILEAGPNNFLHARGDWHFGFHHKAYGSFMKDFAEDISVDPGGEALTDSPATEPPLTPADGPPQGPSSSPTLTPGTVMRFFCTWDGEPLKKKYCEEDRYPEWYTEAEKCESECKDEKKKSCQSILCITHEPTPSPTASASPSAAESASPTSSPVNTPPTSSPTPFPFTSLPTRNNTEGTQNQDEEAGDIAGPPIDSNANLVLTTPGPTPPRFVFVMPEDEERPTESIPLSTFRLEFTVGPLYSGDDGGRRLGIIHGRRQMDGEDEDEGGKGNDLLYIVSEHIFKQFERNLDGELVSVDLGIVSKTERSLDSTAQGLDHLEVGTDVFMASYYIAGSAVYAIDNGSSSMPTMGDLNDEVLYAFNTRRGKRKFMTALVYSDDDILQRIMDVEASNGNSMYGNEMDPNRATENDDVRMVGGRVYGGTGDSSQLTVTFAVLIAAALATTFTVVGLLVYRKYRRFQHNSTNNEYARHHSKKRKITIDKSAKKLKQYDQYQSPEGSVAGSQEPINTGLEIRGGDIHPLSQGSIVDLSTPRPAKQFDPAVPYDEESSPTTTAYDMTYFANAANQMQDESRDDTLEGLYSDKDSYFASTIAPSTSGSYNEHHRRGDSLHSLDTLDNTFGIESTSVSHLVDGIAEIVQNGYASGTNPHENVRKEGQGDESERLTPYSHRRACLTSGDDEVASVSETAAHIGGGTSSNSENNRHIEEPLLKGDSLDKGNDDSLQWRSNDNMTTPKISNVDAENHDDGEGMKPAKTMASAALHADGKIMTPKAVNASTAEKAASDDSFGEKECGDVSDGGGDPCGNSAEFRSPNTSEISTTDELYARITELENKILNTESQLAQDDSIRLAAPSKIKVVKEETSYAPTHGVPAEPSALQNGVFTKETLGMIERSRLSGTPPPSESEVDSEMIREVKDKTLLGNIIDSDSEEESVFQS